MERSVSARLHAGIALQPHTTIALPAPAARHAQVLRLQPGSAVTLFNGDAGSVEGEYDATVSGMGRSQVQVRIGEFRATRREKARPVYLAVGMPANDRMDWLVEKAVELGVAGIQPLMTERSVLRLQGERADKKLAHWRAIAVAACEQCGRNRLPPIAAPAALADWLAALAAGREEDRWLLSLRHPAPPLRQAGAGARPALLLSGPEGGLATHEEEAALAAGFAPASLGPLTLRAETAPLAAAILLAAG